MMGEQRECGASEGAGELFLVFVSSDLGLE